MVKCQSARRNWILVINKQFTQMNYRSVFESTYGLMVSLLDVYYATHVVPPPSLLETSYRPVGPGF